MRWNRSRASTNPSSDTAVPPPRAYTTPAPRARAAGAGLPSPCRPAAPRLRPCPLGPRQRVFAPVDVECLFAARAHHRARHPPDGLARGAARAHGIPRAPALGGHHGIRGARHDAPAGGTNERELEVGMVHTE